MEAFRLLIVTGMSGAGKTQVLQALEDMGYLCIDNNFDILSIFPANEQLKVHVPRYSCAAIAAVSSVITAWSIVPSAVRRSVLNTAVRSPLSTSRRKEIREK